MNSRRFQLVLTTLVYLFPCYPASWIATTLLAAPSSNVALPINNKNVHLLILPGFGNDMNDYRLPRSPQGSLVRSLEKRGWKSDRISILPVQRVDWLLVFLKGIFDWNFWLGNTKATDPPFRWYLDRIKLSVDEAVATSEKGAKVLLICHSAGGWLARAALGYKVISDLDDVCGIVTLGSPHQAPPESVMDMTRGALRSTDADFPGAFHGESLFYITVAGDAIQGVPEKDRSFLGPQTTTGFAFNSYEAVSGVGTAVGDGVVPISHAHLDGATQLTLPGIFHSINVSTVAWKFCRVLRVEKH